MHTSKRLAQRSVFEVRYPTRANLLTWGGEIADALTDQYTNIEIGLDSIKLENRAQFRLVTIGPNALIIEIEGTLDIEPTLSSVVSLFQNHAKPTKIVRLGFRQWILETGLSRFEAMRKMQHRMFGPSLAWTHASGADSASDVAIIFEFNSTPPHQGRIQFGPYIPEANSVSFRFRDHSVLKTVQDGMFFDCDFGEMDPELHILEQENLASWVSHAHDVIDHRIDLVMRGMVGG